MTMRFLSVSGPRVVGSNRSVGVEASDIGVSLCTWRSQQRLGALGSLVLACAGCTTASHPGRPALDAAARANAASAYTLRLNLFGRDETGWAVYAPRIALSIGATQAAQSPAFARALARWQARHGLGATGAVDVATLQALKRGWQGERPFVALRARGVCPPPPASTALGAVAPGQGYGGKAVQLRVRALAAYARLLAAARRTGDPRLAAPRLEVFSGYRDPQADALRCAAQGNCQGVVRAACSAHRTGLALDLALDTAPGLPVDSSADVNRLTMARSYAYRWLLAEAPRYGFVNYAFEPWHWEWTGERP